MVVSRSKNNNWRLCNVLNMDWQNKHVYLSKPKDKSVRMNN